VSRTSRICFKPPILLPSPIVQTQHTGHSTVVLSLWLAGAILKWSLNGHYWCKGAPQHEAGLAGASHLHGYMVGQPLRLPTPVLLCPVI
jgi:hypothetical protein